MSIVKKRTLICLQRRFETSKLIDSSQANKGGGVGGVGGVGGGEQHHQ